MINAYTNQKDFDEKYKKYLQGLAQEISNNNIVRKERQVKYQEFLKGEPFVLKIEDTAREKLADTFELRRFAKIQILKVLKPRDAEQVLSWLDSQPDNASVYRLFVQNYKPFIKELEDNYDFITPSVFKDKYSAYINKKIFKYEDVSDEKNEQLVKKQKAERTEELKKIKPNRISTMKSLLDDFINNTFVEFNNIINKTYSPQGITPAEAKFLNKISQEFNENLISKYPKAGWENYANNARKNMEIFIEEKESEINKMKVFDYAAKRNEELKGGSLRDLSNLQRLSVGAGNNNPRLMKLLAKKNR